MKQNRRESIIRNSIGFLTAILLHLLILILFLLSDRKISVPPPKDNGKKISLDLTNFVPPPAPKPKPIVKPTPTPQPVVKPEPKKIVEKKEQPKSKVVEEKKVFVAKKAIEDNNITQKTKIEKEVIEKKIVKKREIKKEEPKKKRIVKKTPPKKVQKIVKKRTPKRKTAPRQSSSLGNALMSSSRSRSIQTSSRSRKTVSAATKNIIRKLYGSEFDSYGPAQKRFIENNLAIIHRITQGTLSRNGYPQIAARTGQQGVNVVSFNLAPNGNISKLRLEQEMGYTALDQNTLQVIRIAYKDYPLPRKTTKIKFYVEYTIY